ncbi:hypothetical protein [Ideonella sp.]|uniref:hypothetical protein n=1 Tax=Ideonella sp. TaxID=1929293 RepID=UPI002B48632C|nr:hypothetical protein [Ideonella sp.]HJV72513.1 hypothetical protein [Ideonella sp.]
MLICNKLIFIELQKTGSTHIKQLLRELVGGVNDGKHNTPDARLLGCGKPFIGSVRNPWLWYLSLWSYGCQRKGELFQRLTNEKRWQRMREKGEARRAREAASGAGDDDADRRLPADWCAERAKDYWYADPDNAEAFREWIQAVLGRRALRHMLMAGYGKSPIGKAAGLMTYRYFNLFVNGTDAASPMMNNLLSLKMLDRSGCIVSHFIRNESLAPDFIRVVESCGVKLSDDQREHILSARKVNTSTRPHGPDYYYDEASIKLVARRERFIIDKFGYRDARPALATAAPVRLPAGAAAVAGKPAAQRVRKEPRVHKEHRVPRAQRAQRESAVAAV